MSDMIPIKVADMAVEACNKEITKLLFEKAELQGRVIALEAEVKSERAAYNALRSLSFTTAVPSEEYEKLKAENARLKAENEARRNDLYELDRVCGFYKSEVERLTQEYTDATNHYNKLHNDLKAEVERLRNLSNTFLDVCDKYAMFRNDDERLIARASCIALREAAKDGKPCA